MPNLLVLWEGFGFMWRSRFVTYPVKRQRATTGVGSWLPPMARGAIARPILERLFRSTSIPPVPTVHEALGRTFSQQVLGITPSRYPIISSTFSSFASDNRELFSFYSAPQTRLNKPKSVNHILPTSLGQDLAGNMDGNNGDGVCHLIARGTEGSSRARR